MTIPLDAPTAAELRPVKAASLGYDNERALLRSVGVLHWGSFDEDDRINLVRSIEDTLEAATRGSRSFGAPLDVHVVIRTYLVAASNREGLVVSGVEWSAAEPDKRVLFQDAFYAAYTCGRPPNFCTLGINKNAVHAAIVKRIAQDALALAAGERPGTRVVEKTYATLEEAAAAVPTKLSSGYETDSVRVPVEQARMTGAIDWSRRLGGTTPEDPGDLINCAAKGPRQWTRRSDCQY